MSDDLVLKIIFENGSLAKKIQFTNKMTVAEACGIIKNKFGDVVSGRALDYALMMPGKTCLNGMLQPDRELGIYNLKSNDRLDFCKIINNLRVRMLDDAIKTMSVDFSLPVSQLMSSICLKIGLTNHEEYGLILDESESHNPHRTVADDDSRISKRHKPTDENDQKMAELRNRIFTDDDLNWLPNNKSLMDCSIKENDTLLLRKRLFFSDPNIDTSNPVQLNLLYVQIQADILNGKHPVPRDIAIKLGGLQALVEYGSVRNIKQSPGYDYKKFLPVCFYGSSKIEKELIQAHQDYADKSALEAKLLYVETARTLKTYGVTFFLIKEKVQGKNKLKPRLFGINKNSILRLDENSKKILDTWPLTTVKYMTNNLGTVTIDFGSLRECYYIKSAEDVQIIELLTGYIEIIKKNQRSNPDTENRAETPLRTKPSIRAKPNSNFVKLINEVQDLAKEKARRRASLGISKKEATDLSNYIQEIVKILDIGCDHLNSMETMPPLGTDPIAITWREEKYDAAKQNLTTYVATMNSAVAHIIIGNQPDDPQYEYIKVAISQFEQSVPTVTKEVRFLAALMNDKKDADRLLDTTKKLLNEYKNLLCVVKPESVTSQNGVLEIIDKIGQLTAELTGQFGSSSGEHKSMSSLIACLMQSVSTEGQNLVDKCNGVADDCDNESIKKKMLNSVNSFEMSSNMLVGCSKLVLPTFNNAGCRAKLDNSVEEVSKAANNMTKQCAEGSTNEQLKKNMWSAFETLEEKLQNLSYEIKHTVEEEQVDLIDDHLIENVVIATDQLCSATDPADIMKLTKQLTLASTKLIKNIQEIAETKDDPNYRNNLLSIANELADGMQRVVDLAKECDAHPDSLEHRDNLRLAAAEIRKIAKTITSSEAMKQDIIHQLHQCCKNTTEAITKCQATGQSASGFSSNVQAKEQFMHDCNTLTLSYPKIISSMTKANANPDDPLAQFALIEAAEQLRQIGTDLAASSRNLQSSVGNLQASKKFNDSICVLNDTVNELRSTATLARKACNDDDFDSSQKTLRRLMSIIEQTKAAYEAKELTPLPGDSADASCKALGAACRNVDVLLVQLLRATEQGNKEYAAIAGRDITKALADLVKCSRGVAVTTHNSAVLDRVTMLVDNTTQLLEAVQLSLAHLEHPEYRANLLNTAQSVQLALNETIDCLPGLQKISDAERKVEVFEKNFDSKKDQMASDRKIDSDKLQQKLMKLAESLNTACTEITKTPMVPVSLGKGSADCEKAFDNLMKIGTLLMTDPSIDEAKRQEIKNSLLGITTKTRRLLQTMRSVAIDPDQTNSKNNLTFAVRGLTEEINAFLNSLQKIQPCQTECDSTIRSIEALRPLLQSPEEPLLDIGYYECMGIIKAKSMELGEAIQSIAKGTPMPQDEDMEKSVNKLSDAIVPLIEAAVQGAYLIGVSNPTSVAGRPGIINQGQLIRAAQIVRHNSDIIRFNTSDSIPPHDQLMAISAAIESNVDIICKACHAASAKTTNPVAKQQFLTTASEIEKLKKLCCREIMSLECKKNVDRCTLALDSLMEEILALIEFAESPEYASVPAKISQEGRVAQQPILVAGRCIMESGVQMIQAAKTLSGQPKDVSPIKELISSSHTITENIEMLKRGMEENAPGQLQCTSALQALAQCNRSLNTAIETVGNQDSGMPQDRKDADKQEYVEQALKAANESLEYLDPLNIAAKNNAEDLGHTVTELSQQLIRLINNTVAACSVTDEPNFQTLLIDQGKTVVESASQFIKFAKKSGGNPRTTDLHEHLDEHESNCGTALLELKQTLERLTNKNAIVTGLIEEVSRSSAKLSDRRKSLAVTGSFVEYQTRMVDSANEIVNYANKMNANATIDPAKVSELAIELTKHYKQLVQDAVGAAATSTSSEISERINEYVQNLGQSIITMMRSTTNVQPENEESIAELTNNTRNVTEKVSQVLAALQAGSQGTQACIDVSKEIQNVVSDLQTTIMFASAGALQSDAEDSQDFSECKKDILNCAKLMTEQMKILINATIGTQEELAEAAQNVMPIVLQMCEAVKSGACALGPEQSEAQVMLINSVLDVTSSVGGVVNAAKMSVGKSIHDSSITHLQDAATNMMDSTKSLIKTIKTIDNEDERGSRAIEVSIEAISREIRRMVGNDQSVVSQRLTNQPHQATITTRDLLRATKNMKLAAKKAVAAADSDSQTEKIAAANMGRTCVSELFSVYKAVALNCADSQELKKTIWDLAMMQSISYSDLLKGILNNCSTEERQRLYGVLELYVTEACDLAHEINELEDLNIDDSAPAAEEELTQTANNIEAAASKLKQLKIRPESVKPDEASIEEPARTYDGGVIDIAQEILSATAKLIRDANEAQKELVLQGRMSEEKIDSDQWSEGLISAAKYISIATNSLIEAAQNYMQGIGSEAMLISSAKQVAGSTAQLLISFKVKKEKFSKAGVPLQKSANAVMKATQKMVKSAQQSIKYDDIKFTKPKTVVSRVKLEMNARGSLQKLEKKMEIAMSKLVELNRAKYQSAENKSGDNINEVILARSDVTDLEIKIKEAQYKLAAIQKAITEDEENGETPAQAPVTSQSSPKHINRRMSKDFLSDLENKIKKQPPKQ